MDCTVLRSDWSDCWSCALIGPVSVVFVFQKLKAIEELKEQQACGKVLQKNQVIVPQNPQEQLDTCLFMFLLFCWVVWIRTNCKHVQTFVFVQLEKIQKEEQLLKELQELEVA